MGIRVFVPAFAALALAAGPALGQDAPAPPQPSPPAPAPVPAAPPESKEGALKDGKGVEITFDEDRVESQDGRTVWYYSVNFVDPKVLRTELDQWKTADAKIEPMSGAGGQPTNLLRIQERKENLPLLRRMLELLDQPTPQVLVRAKLVEITYSGKLEWGFETTYTAPERTFFTGGGAVFNPDSYLTSTAASPFQGGTFKFAFSGDSKSRYGSLDYVVRLLKSQGRAEILGEPNILATQGQKAIVKAGEKFPIQTANLQGTAILLSTSFEETGITLEITPELIGRDAVRMKLHETFSAVTGLVAGQAGTQNPLINKREAETVLTVRNGSTLVVGGLQSSRSVENAKGIPLLMDIPVLGWFFSTNSKEDVKTELYFIATPEIIRGSWSEGLIMPPGEKERLGRLKHE
jgi:type II secretory pathway component GspD/PulD (secretin)